ncbi:SulP family inorganic anion transporter [Dyadobacter sandarakinus]|uniref:SulP family inorganic anion transporter n=1 Tax=Dyadobacter sandarakinus TaxID=2747268 RepID=A0ABX7ICR0_9BACT|nr:SulP family inorganic anion transporter [Dyadobacter sandarakinus]QRR03719.1 SulP family inorganic anion transporter [Dyadobacter sandarakinus]
MRTKSATWKPATGFAGFRQNWKRDLLSGFLVSLIALPLSLGIAAASNFPPMMGVITAIAGGMIVSFFTNSELTIKGPAAGLIVIASGAVSELGRGNVNAGWQLALGTIMIAGLFQILLGLMKLPRLADFFPLSVVQGLLAAIGIMIMARQIHLAVGTIPSELDGKEPLELVAMLPNSLLHMEYHIAIVGLVSLMIMFGWRYLSFSYFKKLPPALVVLVVAIGLGRFFHLFDHPYHDFKPLINPGRFSLGFHVSLAGLTPSLLPVFIKYVMLFTLAGSLESILTVKAIDLLDPFKRRSDLSRDVAAVGAGNILAGALGGLPMISEVVRSSANVYNGGRTRQANFFHGLFLLILVLPLAEVVRMVPVAALAAMLIFVGFRLASPAKFAHIYHIGREQLIIFLVTIAAALGAGLLMGLVCGILTKIGVQLVYGVKLSHLFDPGTEVDTDHEVFYVNVPHAAVFTNYLGLKSTLEAIPKGKMVQIDFSGSPYVDHTVMDNITRFKHDYEQSGGDMELIGFEHHLALSDHPLAARRLQRQTVLS